MDSVFDTLKDVVVNEDAFEIIDTRNKKWYTDGFCELEIYPTMNVPEGFKRGRLAGQKRCAWKTKRYWWNNGVDEALLQNCPDGWVKGRIPDRIKNFKAKKGASGVQNRDRQRDASGRFIPINNNTN